MKKLLSILMLLVAVTIGAKAETTTLYERGTTNAWGDSDLSAWAGSGTAAIDGGLKTSGGNEGYERTLAVSPTSNAIVTLTATWNTGSSTGRAGGYNYLILGGVEFRAYGQDAKGSVVIGGTETTITTNKNDVRGGVWTITATINTATGAVTTAVTVPNATESIETSGTATTAISSIVMGFYKPGRVTSTYQTLTKVEITEETQSVTTADYTINYVYNESTIKTTEGNTAIGNVVEAENPITVDDVKYYIKDGETTSMTIVEGTNELNVDMRVADTYSYTVRGVDGSSNVLDDNLASGSATEGNSVTVSFPRYILSGTTLYCQNTGAVSYSTTFTPDADAYVKDITYNNSTVSNVAFYTEGEDVSDASVGSNVRASKGTMGHTGSSSTYKDVTTLAPGKYVIYMRGQNGNKDARAYSFKVGDTEVFSGSIAQGTNQDANSTEFTVSTSSTLSFASEGSGQSGIDYFYLVKTAEIVTISTSGISTLASAYALDFSEVEGLEAYVIDETTETAAMCTQITEAPAATGVILTGTASAQYTIPVVASAEAPATNLLSAAVEATELAAGDAILKDGEFHPINNASTIPAGKAYLTASNVSSARSLTLNFGGVTGVNAVEAAAEVQAADGKYFENGKIVIVKNGKKFNAAGAQVK